MGSFQPRFQPKTRGCVAVEVSKASNKLKKTVIITRKLIDRGARYSAELPRECVFQEETYLHTTR